MYGPTETTVWSATADLSRDPTAGVVPIGSPLPGTQVFVLDAGLGVMPPAWWVSCISPVLVSPAATSGVPD